MRRLEQRRIAVLGDLMVDRYTVGAVRRISPEAPVMVLEVTNEESRPGGAGNAMLNLRSLGQEVVAIGRIGDDSPGHSLLEAFTKEEIDRGGLVCHHGYRTPVKNRMIASNQQLMRVDWEALEALPADLEDGLIDKLPTLLADVDALAISDYGKGFCSRRLLQAAIAVARERQIPIISDPKGRDFSLYAGSTLLKPNLGEAIDAAGLTRHHALEEVAQAILSSCNVDHLMITRSEHGISLFSPNNVRTDHPVEVHEVRDVTGAGDTVLAVTAAALANDLPLSEAADLSNIAASLAVQRFGCARITLAELGHVLTV